MCKGAKADRMGRACGAANEVARQCSCAGATPPLSDERFSSGSFKDGYHSVVATWDGTNRNTYLDGVLQSSVIPAWQRG